VRGEGGVHARTIGHAHRVLSKALSDAAENDLVSRNVCRARKAPKVDGSEMAIVQDVPALIEALRPARLFAIAMTALFTGMRLGEVLALRWGRLDIDGKMVKVREALEETRAHGVRFKEPKSKAGVRDISLPDVVVDVLREYRKQQLELRLQLGTGRPGNDDLVFHTIEGGPQAPNNVSAEWSDLAAWLGIPEITFHALRHTHASQLIDAGVDVVTISKRLGHSKPDITLRIYAHRFQKDDSKAAAAINAAFGGK